MTQEVLYSQLKNALVEMFDLPADKIKLGATLFGDLDIDSIDTIDLIVRLEEITGKITGQKPSPQDFKGIRTVGDVVDLMDRLSQKIA